MSDFIWTLSRFCALVGMFSSASCREGDKDQKYPHTGYAWWGEDSYWLWLDVDEEGKCHATIAELYVGSDTDKMYKIIGYCKYHEINLVIYDTFVDED